MEGKGDCTMQETIQAYRIDSTQDFITMQKLFHQNGLEVNLEDDEGKGVLGLWRAVDAHGDLLGGLKIEERSGELVLACIAVEEPSRKLGIGAELLQIAIHFAIERQEQRLLLVAKAPSFFKKFGFYEVDMEEYRHITKCYTCAQRGISCYPEVLRMDFSQ